ncbi:MAG: hypothetical protein H6744_13535 [Deltaproteobacteria bacterium]|nr:hypothetical protein [Deltaproteobacteria bacterium]
MHVVAIHDIEPADGSRAAALAAVLGVTPYDARSRVMNAGPSVVAVLPEPAEARALASRLDAAGFATIVRDAATVERDAFWSPVRSFVVEPRSLLITPVGGDPHPLPWAAIRLILRGTDIARSTTTTTATEKKFSVGRAVVSGGLVRNKKVKVQHTHDEQTREGFLHVYAAGHPVSVFVETAVDYTGLGELLQSARTANFLVLLGLLRERAPQAAFDERLLHGVGQGAILGPRLDPSRHLRLASALIAAAAARISDGGRAN